jgi:hypothetical protein
MFREKVSARTNGRAEKSAKERGSTTAKVVAACVGLVSFGLFVTQGSSVAAPATKASKQCASGIRVVLTPANVTDVAPAWQPGSNLFDNQDAVDANQRSWEWSAWSPNFPFSATTEVDLGGAVDVSAVIVASPAFGNSGGDLQLEVGGVPTLAKIPATNSAFETTLLGVRTNKIRITRTAAANNAAEILVCASGVSGDTSTSSTTSTTKDIPVDNGGCVANPPENGMQSINVCIEFPTGNRRFTVASVVSSFGTSDPPVALSGPPWKREPSDCSVQLHNRWWVKGADQNFYHTWHPPRAQEADGTPCSFGHEHGDDPRTSPLYTWSGGVPFGYVNVVAGDRLEEDHVGHKIFVETQWEAIAGNGANGDIAAARAGFHCDWLSQIHQGTHGPDAFNENAHEYHANIVCDDGQARFASGRTVGAEQTKNTEVSIKLLASFGSATEFLICPSAINGGIPRPSSKVGQANPIPDSRRVISCFTDIATNRPDASPRAAKVRTGEGIEELWRPAGVIKNPTGGGLQVNPYYQVWDPIRIYNDAPPWANFPRTHHANDGGTSLDDWSYTIDICYNPEALRYLKGHNGFTQCDNLAPALEQVPASERWKSPLSPFRGMKRSEHFKGVQLDNADGFEFRCTSADGVSQREAGVTNGLPSCQTNEILQRMSKVNNLWNAPEWVRWGPNRAFGNVQGSDVNYRPDGTPAGYGLEWVRFYDEFNNSGIHGPN